MLGCFTLWMFGATALFLSGYFADELDLAAAILAIIVLGVIGAPGGVAGVFLLVRGSSEEQQLAQLRLEQDILGRVRTRGEVGLDELAGDLGVPHRVVETALYSLVGKNLFTGYVDWANRRLISREASQILIDRCPNCGGEMAVAGKDVIRCGHCGSDVFLTEGQAPSSRGG